MTYESKTQMKVSLPVPAQYLLSILAPSYLLTHQGADSIIQTLMAIGSSSEEVFRGDRLPPLPFPDGENPETPQENSDIIPES